MKRRRYNKARIRQGLTMMKQERLGLKKSYDRFSLMSCNISSLYLKKADNI